MVYSDRSGTDWCNPLVRLLDMAPHRVGGRGVSTTAAYWQPPIIARYKSEITMDPATP